MKYLMPAVVYEENEAVWNHRAELAALGKCALIMTGRHSAMANGSLDDVKKALDDRGVSYTVFSEVEENPSIETVARAAEQGRRDKADFVIGIGGGSPMDAAKAAAFLIKHEGKGAADLYDASIDSSAVPVAEVPTTCGTGSEVTAVSVLTRDNGTKKGSIPHKIFADLALIDGKYLMNAPLSVIRNTAVDALGHLLESGLNSDRNDYSIMFVREGLRFWNGIRDILTGDRAIDSDSAMKLMHASALAGIAIAQTGTTVPHGLSYTLTCELNMPHGAAVGYYLGSYLKEAYELDPEYAREFLELAGFSDPSEFEEFFAKVCDTGEAPSAVLNKAYETILPDKKRLSTASYAIDAEVLKRIARI
ncbi:alcohol dehydrogenase [Lachnospiraceae bacterium]|nr:alcohol dehydrogenase [Lachnospiraceae bacterium]